MPFRAKITTEADARPVRIITARLRDWRSRLNRWLASCSETETPAMHARTVPMLDVAGCADVWR